MNPPKEQSDNAENEQKRRPKHGVQKQYADASSRSVT